MVKNLAEEKSELEKKYNGLVAEVNKILEDSVRKVQLENYAKLKEEEKNETCGNARIKAEAQLAEMVKENNLLKDELLALKRVQQNEAELKKKLEEEKKTLEEEKKTLKEDAASRSSARPASTSCNAIGAVGTTTAATGMTTPAATRIRRVVHLRTRGKMGREE